MSNVSSIASLEDILTTFFIALEKGNLDVYSPFSMALWSIFHHTSSPRTISCALDDESAAETIRQVKNMLFAQKPELSSAFNSPLTYLCDELICNIQQHAQTDKGHIYAGYNPQSDSIEIAIADYGVTIYGSYVAAQKHLDKLGDSDADALNLAQNGYSVKNLPDTENRGYGISSNIRMVANGLHGEFAVMSGNALLLRDATKRKILSLPKDIDFKGTMVLVRIPAQIPNGFNMYDYMS
jgi:hypothetical protein